MPAAGLGGHTCELQVPDTRVPLAGKVAVAAAGLVRCPRHRPRPPVPVLRCLSLLADRPPSRSVRGSKARTGRVEACLQVKRCIVAGTGSSVAATKRSLKGGVLVLPDVPFLP